MSALAVIAALVFAGAAALSAITAIRARAGEVSTGSTLRLRSALLDASDEACRTGHSAVWPLLAMTAALGVFHALGCAVAGGLMGADGAPFVQALAVSGVITLVALVLDARSAAGAAIRRSAVSEDPGG